MGKPPDYNPTVPNTGTVPEVGVLAEALVDREHVVAVSGTPTTSDAFPTDGRVAVDTSTDPDTYYIGDGSSWVQAFLGSPANPDSGDLAGSDGALTANGGPHQPYVFRVDSTSSTANLQGLTASWANPGQLLVLMGASGGITNAVTVVDDASVTNAFQTTGGSNQTIDAATDIHTFVFDGTDWSQVGSGGGN